MKISLITIIIAAAVTVTSGATHRLLVDRYRAPEVTQKLDVLDARLPESVGDWHTTSTWDLPENAQSQLHCLDSACRRYINRSTGEFVEVMLLFGPSGPLTVHTPEVCFPARNFVLEESGDRVAVEGQPEGTLFSTVGLRSRDVDATRLDVAYAWNAGEGWRAPKLPRVVFARAQNIYKIQVATSTAAFANKENTDGTNQNFLQVFLPAIRDIIRPTPPHE